MGEEREEESKLGKMVKEMNERRKEKGRRNNKWGKSRTRMMGKKDGQRRERWEMQREKRAGQLGGQDLGSASPGHSPSSPLTPLPSEALTVKAPPPGAM